MKQVLKLIYYIFLVKEIIHAFIYYFFPLHKLVHLNVKNYVSKYNIYISVITITLFSF